MLGSSVRQRERMRRRVVCSHRRRAAATRRACVRHEQQRHELMDANARQRSKNLLQEVFKGRATSRSQSSR